MQKEIGLSRGHLEGLERNLAAQISCRPKLDLLRSCIEGLKCSLLACKASPAVLSRNATVGEVSPAACRSLLDRVRGNPRVTRPQNQPGAPLDLRPPSQQNGRN